MRGEELLIQYIESGLNPEERFELEKLTLDDAFLADAYEGITGPDSKQAALIIARIRKSLDEQKVKDKVIPMYRKLWPYAVAASLIFVASVGILLRPASEVTSYAQESTSDTYETSTVAEAIEEIEAPSYDEGIVETQLKKRAIKSEKSTQATPVQIENDFEAENAEETSSQNGITLTVDDLSIRKNKKETLAAPRSSANNISLSRRAPVEKSNPTSDFLSGQVLSVETSNLENASIPNSKAISNDPIPNGLTDAKLQALPQGEKPVPIPNDFNLKLDAATSSLSDKSNIPNTSILKKGKFDFQSAQNLGLDSNENIVLPGSQLTLADGMTAYLHSSPVLGESVIINTSPQTFDKAFTAYALMVATLDEDSNENCATTKAKYRSEYEEKPDLALAHDLYNLLKARGCPRDGSDAFMVELKNDYEAWAAE